MDELLGLIRHSMGGRDAAAVPGELVIAWCEINRGVEDVDYLQSVLQDALIIWDCLDPSELPAITSDNNYVGETSLVIGPEIDTSTMGSYGPEWSDREPGELLGMLRGLMRDVASIIAHGAWAPSGKEV